MALQFKRYLLTSVVALILWGCSPNLCRVGNGQDRGVFVELKTMGTCPVIDVESNLPQKKRFIIAASAAQVILFRNSKAGQAILASYNVDVKVIGEGDCFTLDSQLRVDGVALTNKLITTMEVPAKHKDEFDQIGGIIGLDSIAQPIVEFDLKQKSFFLTNELIKQTDSQEYDLFHSSAGFYSVVLPAGGETWSFKIECLANPKIELCHSLANRFASPLSDREVLRELLDEQSSQVQEVQVVTSATSSNSLSLGCLASKRAVLDRKRMKIVIPAD